MARGPARPALAANFKVRINKADVKTIAQVVLPRLPVDPSLDTPPLLTLRRAAASDRLFHDWWDEARNGDVMPRTVTVTMLGANLAPLFGWRFPDARPAALSYGLLDAASPGVLMETLDLAFDQVERI